MNLALHGFAHLERTSNDKEWRFRVKVDRTPNLLFAHDFCGVNSGWFPRLRDKARVAGSSWDAGRPGRGKKKFESQRRGKPSRLLVHAEDLSG
jgi:hypothetical protein